MKIDFSQVIKGPNGDPAKDGNGKDVTLRAVCVAALLREDDIKPEEKLRRYNLANKVRFNFTDGTESGPNCDVQDLALIETLVGKHQSTWVYGVVHDVFNGKAHIYGPEEDSPIKRMKEELVEDLTEEEWERGGTVGMSEEAKNKLEESFASLEDVRDSVGGAIP